MKHWQETTTILERAAALHERGETAALATVTWISGSAYRRSGAKFLVDRDGGTLGSVSGGCLEEDVRQNGLLTIEDGGCRTLHYETGADEDTVWGLGLGCDGAVDIFLQPLTAPDMGEIIRRTRALLEGDRSFALVTVIEAADDGMSGGTLVVADGAIQAGSTGSSDLDEEIAAAAERSIEAGTSRRFEVGECTVFAEVLIPPPYLILCGAGDDAIPLVSQAAGVGYRVVVIDHRAGYLTEARFPGAARLIRALADDDIEELPAGPDTWVVVKTHNLERDRVWCRRFLATAVPYVGLLGPRDRREDIGGSIDVVDTGRLFGPVGLDLGAEGPEQVAVSIVSELLAVRNGRQPRHLRERRASIHAT